ncbi:hypothetical protein JCM19046_137 [Bacillus sp. JCM 19046]|nr:hypothetical protein JCM19045_4445 [Bacillus sp. JCM 19045]GAF15741.1 hypothetical protein JCM19046_137 [Bacillus sp. JCM 19046]
MRQYEQERFRVNAPYHPQIQDIDEQICALLQKRKQQSAGNPGIPTDVLLEKWADQYQLEEDMLYSIFYASNSEKDFKPVVVPKNYQKTIPVHKWHEENGVIYSISTVQQYTNASVMVLQTIWDNNRYEETPTYTMIDLGSSFQVVKTDGVGSSGTKTERFVITPPLTDDLPAIKVTVKQMENDTRVVEWSF